MDKKALKTARDDFSLHVLLAMRDGHSKPVASAVAYAEGRAGLQSRLTLPPSADGAATPLSLALAGQTSPKRSA